VRFNKKKNKIKMKIPPFNPLGKPQKNFGNKGKKKKSLKKRRRLSRKTLKREKRKLEKRKKDV
jgi:hypothetical protein